MRKWSSHQRGRSDPPGDCAQCWAVLSKLAEETVVSESLVVFKHFLQGRKNTRH